MTTPNIVGLSFLGLYVLLLIAVPFVIQAAANKGRFGSHWPKQGFWYGISERGIYDPDK